MRRIASLAAATIAVVQFACSSGWSSQPAADNATRNTALAACTGCHGDPANGNAGPPRSVRGATSTTDRAVGAHQAHLRDGALRAAIDCTECHVVPATINDAGHIGGPTATLTWGPLAGAGGAAPSATVSPDGLSLTCTNYCHGASFPAGNGSNHAPSWTQVDGTQAACGTCHGVPPPSPHPTVSNGLPGCNACHPGTVKPDGSIDVAGGLHIDGKVEAGGTGCTGCHGDATRTPAAIAPAPPIDTHGNTATTAAGVGAHQAHLTDGPLRSAMGCTDCHVVPADTTHATQPLNLTWSALASAGGTTPTWDAAALTCTNYCHGATLSGGSDTSPVWTSGSSQAACGTCHGLPPGTGHHSTHSSRGIDCLTCHGTGYSATSTSHTANPSLHVNGVKDLASGNPPGWDPATRSCTNTCHGQNFW